MAGFGSGPYGGASDTAAPTIGNFNPLVGTPLRRSDFVVFDVEDAQLRRAVIHVALGGDVFVVHDGDTFVGAFSNLSTRTTTATGFRFRVKPNGGWTQAPVFGVIASDAVGNVA